MGETWVHLGALGEMGSFRHVETWVHFGMGRDGFISAWGERWVRFGMGSDGFILAWGEMGLSWLWHGERWVHHGTGIGGFIVAWREIMRMPLCLHQPGPHKGRLLSYIVELQRKHFINKTDVERRQTLGHPISINPNMISHVPKQLPIIF